MSYQILLLITPLFTTPYLSRVLGADGIGTASYVESIVSCFTLFATLGMTTFGQRETSYVQDSREKRTKIFWETNILQFITSMVALLVYVSFALMQDNSILYFVLIFNIISVVANITWFFQGLEEFGKIVFRNVIFKFINIAYVFLVIRSKKGVILYMLGLSIFSLLSNVSLWFCLPKYVELPKWRELRPFRHVKVIIALFIPTIATQIYTMLDKTMIGLITGDAYENGYYEQAVKMAKMTMVLVTSLGTVMVPRIGYNYSRGEREEVCRLMYRGYRFVWFLGTPLCLGLAIVSDNFVPWFFGDGYDQVAVILKILAFLIPAIGINNVTGVQFLIPTKQENLYTISVMAGAVVNFMMNAVLIYYFQAFGAAIASVTAEITIAAVQLWLVRKELSPWQVLFSGWHYYIAGGVMLAGLWSLSRRLNSSIVDTGILVICGGVIYFLVLLLVRDEFFLTNAGSVLNKIVKKVKVHYYK